MATVFQFGQAQFVKDLVFGWCFRADDSSEWTKLSDFPSDVLKELSTATFPTYVPKDLNETILKELESRQLKEHQAREMGSIIAGIWKKHDERLTTAESNASRLGDRIKLMTIILANIKPTHIVPYGDSVMANLGYVEISRVNDKWTIRGDGSTPKAQQVETFNSIDEAIDRILARWW